MKQKLIAELGEFLTFVEALDGLSDEVWFSPLSEGKWSIHDIIIHVMKWDEYFNEVTFPLLAENGAPELTEHPDYLGYNEQSVLYGKGKTKREAVEETIGNRRLLLDQLDRLEERKFTMVYPGERGFTLETYLRTFFISHDKHHIGQIRDYLETN
ncbi:DinB family protein [Paenibacillus phocaensis]|uniref:DinB family protein n=1 Tax=Paenibacillus phocaensis TaxID=1776378 RepID=UPI0003A3FDAE|nr:DinB family protein [Paenibacillus phocaensis]